MLLMRVNIQESSFQEILPKLRIPAHIQPVPNRQTKEWLLTPYTLAYLMKYDD